jgi:hypothetical protein
VFLRNNYGELMGFGITEFKKRIKHKTYEVWKFNGVEMQILG